MNEGRETEALLNRFRPLIAGFFRKRLTGKEEAEDCEQEAILAILGSLKRFEGRSSLNTWIHRICENVFFNHLRRKNAAHLLQERLRSQRPSSPAEPDEKLGILHTIVDRLPPSMRRLYGMYYIDRLSIREIGRALNCPEGSVKFLLHELRNRIKGLLG
jgi:RNA polymerase sigma-70 factor (ECF subfamily)